MDSFVNVCFAALNAGSAIYWVMTGRAILAAINGGVAVFSFGVAMLIKDD